jgi:hypothetical protein
MEFTSQTFHQQHLDMLWITQCLEVYSSSLEHNVRISKQMFKIYFL